MNTVIVDFQDCWKVRTLSHKLTFLIHIKTDGLLETGKKQRNNTIMCKY